VWADGAEWTEVHDDEETSGTLFETADKPGVWTDDAGAGIDCDGGTIGSSFETGGKPGVWTDGNADEEVDAAAGWLVDQLDDIRLDDEAFSLLQD
jgi:hypothetical protein